MFGVLLPATAGLAQVATDAERRLDAVIVTSTRIGGPPLEVPASVDLVDGDSIRRAQPQSNLSEGLGGVPGLVIQNRQNHAQDLQLSIRGFGARSTFGIRGLRLYVDGIPATMPDGQGQSSNIDIGSIERIEVLRGPFSALYGNSSGGVMQVFTEEGSGPTVLIPSLSFGSDNTRRFGLKAGGSTSALDYLASASRFSTDGFRDHSEARRDLANARFGLALGDGRKLTLILNSVDLRAQDPLGLTAQQFRADPRSVAAVAEQFDTRKTVAQRQAGILYEHALDRGNELRVMLYYGQRRTVQFQAIPAAPQGNPLHPGGVIALERNYGGADLRWTSRLELAGGPLTLVGGLAYDTLTEQRRGYENFDGAGLALTLGVQGALRRDEINNIWNADPYLQASWRPAQRWTFEAGLRRSALRLRSEDRYVTGANGNDSGAIRYQQLLPVAALRYEARPGLNVYGTVGRGFETPTINELSYRSDGLSGLNFGLQPSVNTSVEAGLKAQLSGSSLLKAALFQVRTRDEIVSETNVGGRATFRNAGRTRRDGAELSWSGELSRHWPVKIAYTWLDARFRDGFCAPACTLVNPPVTAGNRIPGIPSQVAFASLAWEPAAGWRGGIEGRYVARVHANDRNDEFAPGYAVASVYAGHRLQARDWTLETYARLDNAFDRRYAGSVIVNEGNGRYFEPAPGRNWSAGANLSLRF